MANIKQQKKRVKTDAKKALAQRSSRRKLRTFIVKAEKAIASNDKNAPKILNETKKLLDKASNKHIKKANFVSRQKSRLEKKFNQIKDKK